MEVFIKVEQKSKPTWLCVGKSDCPPRQNITHLWIIIAKEGGVCPVTFVTLHFRKRTSDQQ